MSQVLTAEEEALVAHCELAYEGYPGVQVVGLCKIVRRLEGEVQSLEQAYDDEHGILRDDSGIEDLHLGRDLDD